MLDLRWWIASLAPWGEGIIQWMHTWHTPWLDVFFKAVSQAAGEPALIVLVALIYWSIDRRLGVQLVYVSGLGSFATASLKMAFAIPRPAGANVWVIWAPDRYSFPSGHAQAATTTFGYLAAATRRYRLRLGCLALIPLVAVSRVNLGVHYPQDVIGGFLLGAACLGLFWLVYAPAQAWVETQPTSTLLVYAAFLSAVLLGLGSLSGEGSTPASVGLVYSGFFAGMNLGLIWERKHVRFRVDGPWSRRLTRGVVGLALVAAAFGLGEAAVHLIHARLMTDMRWLQFALVGLTFSCGAPWIFLRLGLCASDRGTPTGPTVEPRLPNRDLPRPPAV
jgi:membrane-associated phospholipid phosphatase